jgi:hypothetical protein
VSERNRVGPDGRIVATDVRGAWMGNRGGSLHPPDGRHEIVRTSAGPHWITCALSFRGRRVEQWAPGLYTPLFFVDEAVSFAAGHRPCSQCRHADFKAYAAAWAAADRTCPGVPGAQPGDTRTTPAPRVAELDARLRAERSSTHVTAWADVPHGAFVVDDGGFALVLDDHLVGWDAARHGYGTPSRRPSSGSAEVQTPAASVAVLRAGYPVQIHPAALS